MDVCWYYFTSSPGFTWSSGRSRCTSESAYLMELEKQTKFNYMVAQYMNSIFYAVINYDIWVRRIESVKFYGKWIKYPDSISYLKLGELHYHNSENFYVAQRKYSEPSVLRIWPSQQPKRPRSNTCSRLSHVQLVYWWINKGHAVFKSNWHLLRIL